VLFTEKPKKKGVSFEEAVLKVKQDQTLQTIVLRKRSRRNRTG